MNLTKSKPATWGGNGFGVRSAQWRVKGHEHIAVYSTGGDWIAVDTRTGARTLANSRAALLSKLEKGTQ